MLLLIPLAASAASLSNVLDAERFLWVGVDYTQVQMVGEDFSEPDSIFPGHINQWNARMASAEAMSALSDGLDKPVKAAVAHLEQLHAALGPDDHTLPFAGGEALTKRPLLSRDALGAAITAYDLPDEEAVGLSFIVEAMVKSNETLCLSATFFSLNERELLHATRYCETAHGMTFSTHWQAPLEAAVDSLRRDMARWRKADKRSKEHLSD